MTAACNLVRPQESATASRAAVEMAGILEVTNKAEKEATKLWTVVPEASDAPPETRSGASVDDMLAMAAVYLGVAATAVKPIVLLPAGFGRGRALGFGAAAGFGASGFRRKTATQ